MQIRSFAESVLYSYAQILFSNRLWFGGALMVIAFFRPEIGLPALAGVVLSNAAAHLLKFDTSRIQSGFYGFNGILFGAAFGYYFEPTPFLWLLFPIFVIIAFLIASVLENYMATAFNLPGLSLPFVFALYIAIIFLKNYDFVLYKIHLSENSEWIAAVPHWLKQFLQSMAFILFQSDALAGLCIAIALLFFSRVLFVLAITGFLANYFFVHLLLPLQAESLGIVTGFNAILTAIALGGSMLIPSRKSFLLAMTAVLMVVIFAGFFSQVLQSSLLPILVLPFNFIVLATLYSLKFRQKSSGLVLLYFQPGNPEENYYYHHTQQARFEKFNYFLPDLPILGEWTVSQGHEGKITHKEDWKYAWDFVVTDETGKTYSNGGTRIEDFYCYKLPVTAPLDGEVVKVIDSISNNRIGDVNLERNWGNTIIIHHGDALYSALSHLEPGTAKVKVGAKVKKGEILALCGNSGRSPEPHLHFQFQTTDKIGDKTLSYPFGYILEDSGKGYNLSASAIPHEHTKIQNLTEHKLIREAFAFKLGNKYEFECSVKGSKSIRETWEVKVDILNSLYIESCDGAVVSFFANNKVFYLTNFRGNKKSALYYFYLSALQVPMSFQPGLSWQDTYPLSKVYHSPLRALSEVFLIFGSLMKAKASSHFAESQTEEKGLLVNSIITVYGIGLLGGVKKETSSSLLINLDGNIQKITHSENNQEIFSARRIPNSH